METTTNNFAKKLSYNELNKLSNNLIDSKVKELAAYVTNNEFSFISSNSYLLDMLSALKNSSIEVKRYGLGLYISIDSKTKIESVDFKPFTKKFYSNDKDNSEGYFRNALDYFLDTKGKSTNFYFDLVMIPKLTLESDYNRMKKELQLSKECGVNPTFKKGVNSQQQYTIFTPNVDLLMKQKTSEINAPAYFLRRYEELVLTIAKIMQGKKLSVPTVAKKTTVKKVEKVVSKKQDKKIVPTNKKK